MGLRRYKRLFFGINCASEVFQNVVRQVIDGIPGTLNLSDDIIVFGRSQEDHDRALKAVFDVLLEKGFTLNAAKYEYSKTSIEFYGFVYSGEGMSPEAQKVAALVNMPDPKSSSEVRSLLGMVNYNSRFIQNYSTLTETLRKLTHKDARFEWTETQSNAVTKLKNILSKNPAILQNSSWTRLQWDLAEFSSSVIGTNSQKWSRMAVGP